MSPEQESSWKWEEDTSAALVTVKGEIDFTSAPQVRKRFKEFMEKTQGDVKLNLSELNYLDSSGLAVFIEARRLLMDQNRSIGIKSIHPQVEKIFRLTQVSELFGI